VTPRIKILLKANYQQRKHRLRDALNKNQLQTFFVVGFVLFFFVGATLLFNGLFHSLNTLFNADQEDVQQILSFVMPLLFSCLFVMLCFSNGIMSWVSLFRDKESNALLVWPLDVKEIYVVKFIESFFFSAWAFFFLAGPLFLGFAFQYDVGSLYLPSTLLLSACFAVMAGATGTLVAILIARYLPRYRKHFLTCVSLLCVGVVIWLYFNYLGKRNTTDGVWLLNLQYNFNFMISAFSPPGWMYRGFRGAVKGDLKEVVFMLGLLLSHGLLFLHLGGLCLAKSYLGCRERIYSSKKKVVKGMVYRWLGPPSGRSVTSLLVWKDFKIFVRDPSQWLQLLLFFGLLFVYFSNLKKFELVQNHMHVRYISTLNLSATLLTLSTFTTRFVFPQLSLEGKRFWFLGLVPLKRSKIIMGKFYFAFVGCFAIAGTLSFVSVTRLGLSPLQIPVQMALSFSVSLGLVGMACGLGVLFADYKASSATKVLSSFGGTLNLVLSAVFLTVEMFLVYPAISRVREWSDFLDPLVAGSFTACLIVGFLAAYVPLKKGIEHINTLDF